VECLGESDREFKCALVHFDIPNDAQNHSDAIKTTVQSEGKEREVEEKK